MSFLQVEIRVHLTHISFNIDLIAVFVEIIV